MTALMVRCPSTGRELSTGIDTDGIDHLPKVGTRMRCLCAARSISGPAGRYGSRNQPENFTSLDHRTGVGA